MFLAAVCVALATLCGCTRTEDLPSVSTSEVTEVTTTTATVGGTILANGASVTVRGVCYSSTNPNPTIDDLHTTDGSGTGEFVSRLEGLQASTTYHVKAYAMNNSGVAYGETRTFTTYEKDEDNYANLLSMHPNGWKLTSATSAPAYMFADGSYADDLINDGYLQDFEAAYILVFKDDYTHYVKPGAVVAPNPNVGYTTLTNLGSYLFYSENNAVFIDMKVPYIHSTATINAIKILSITDSEFKIKCTINDSGKASYSFVLRFVPA